MCDRAASSEVATAAQTLRLEIRADDLARIRGAQLRIILARAAASAQPVVVWASLEPFEINTVTWSDAYGVYAAIVDVVPGQHLGMVSRLSDAQAGYYYSFTPGASFDGPYWDSAVGRNEYGVENAMPYSVYPQLTFGLSLDARVNSALAGEKPVTARSVAATRMAIFPPAPVVYVWLQSGVVSSTVIVRVGDDAVAVDYSNLTTKTLIYDPDLGRFIPKPGVGV